MAGDEYFNLKRGSNVTVETPFSYFTKGQVLKVEYIDILHQQIFLRDTTKELGYQVKGADTFSILNNFVVGGELPEKKNDNKVFELPFAIGDKVWFLYNNAVYNGKIIDCNVQIDSDEIDIKYRLLFTMCGENAVTIASNKLFKTKDELLKSL